MLVCAPFPVYLGSTTVRALRARKGISARLDDRCWVAAGSKQQIWLACSRPQLCLTQPATASHRARPLPLGISSTRRSNRQRRASSLYDFETSALKHSTDYRGTVASLLVALARRSSAYSDVPGVLTTWRSLSGWIRHRRHRRRRRSRFLAPLGTPCRTAPSSHRRT